MRIWAKIIGLLAFVAVFSAACGSGGDDEVVIESSQGSVTRGEVIELLEERELVENGSFAVADFDQAVRDLGRGLVLGDADYVVATAGSTDVTAGQLLATFAEEDERLGQPARGVEDLSESDLAARLTSILSLITFEEAFVSEGFLSSVPEGDFRARGEQLDALAGSQGVLDRAVEWFDTEAQGVELLEANYCLTFFVTADQDRAVAAEAALASGDSFDSLVGLLDEADQYGDDCSVLLAFPDDLAAAVIEMEDGDHSDLVVLEGADGGADSFILVRRIGREREEQPYLKNIVLRVPVDVDPVLGEWNPETRAVQYDPTS